jgi:hypothetical protein
VAQGPKQHILHDVFCVFSMSADLHAEGIDGILQQLDRLCGGFRRIPAE